MEEMPTHQLPRWLNLWRLIPVVGLMLAAYFGADRMLSALHRNLCPADTFLSLPTQIAHVIFVVSPMFVALMIGFLLANLIELVSRELLGWRDWAGFVKSSRLIAIGAGVVFVPVTALMTGSAFSYICVGTTGIAVIPSVLHSVKQYRWPDVESVTAKCFHEGRTNRDSYTLTFSDGARYDIADRRDDFVAAFPMIKTQLGKLPIAFTSEGLANCPDKLRAIFATRP